MTTLICTESFRLNTPEGMLKFSEGDKVEGKAAEHWYAKAHCRDANAKSLDQAAAEAKAEVEAEAKAKSAKK